MPHSKGIHRNHGSHGNHQPVNTRNLLSTTMLNLVITVVEVAGSILSGSIALLSDAIHNLSDTFATFIAYMATLIGKRKANPRKTFGYKRVEILAALLNAVILLVTCIFLIMEAYHRLKDPQPVKSLIMVVVAMIGLLANLFAVLILKRDVHKSINVKAAYVHLLGDMFSSVLVVAGGLMMQIRQLYWIDPLITLLISLYIIREGFAILMESVNILMQSAPSHLDIQKIRERIESDPEISNIHHLHAWMLTDQEVHLEAHVELAKDLKLSQVAPVCDRVETILKRDFHVQHVTLQFEHGTDHPPRLIHQEKEPPGNREEN
jgi:cobalt-zinc-cadmium efflux system protein